LLGLPGRVGSDVIGLLLLGEQCRIFEIKMR